MVKHRKWPLSKIFLNQTWRLGLQIPGETFWIRESELKDGDMSIACPILISELLTPPCLSLSVKLNEYFIIFP